MPSGRGRKGQQPPRKRVCKEPVESTVPFQPSSNTCASSSSCSTTVLSATMSELPPLSATMSELPPAAHGYVTPTTFAPIQYNSPSFHQCFPPSYPPMPFRQPPASTLPAPTFRQPSASTLEGGIAGSSKLPPLLVLNAQIIWCLSWFGIPSMTPCTHRYVSGDEERGLTEWHWRR